VDGGLETKPATLNVGFQTGSHRRGAGGDENRVPSEEFASVLRELSI